MATDPLDAPESVIACHLGAIDSERLDAHVALAQELFSSSTVLDLQELAQGYAFRLPLETSMLFKSMEFIANERLCCPFFTFTLVVGDALWLELSGTDQVKAYLKANLVPAVETGIFPAREALEAASTASGGSANEEG